MRPVWLAAFTALALGSATAEAQPTREYFSALAERSATPRHLDEREREHYRAVFAAIDRKDWAAAATLLDQRPDGLLTPVARAELYLAAGSPRVELPQIQAWLDRGRALPQAAQLSRLALTRGATELPDLPAERGL